MLQYNSPVDGSYSTIDQAGSNRQMQDYKWIRKAIIEARDEQFFMPLATAENMPKHFGKTLKVHEWVPLLDDRNVNDQGIDAAGVAISDGNLFGSSKDIGTITSKLPTLTETGGRVNRVGMTRLVREGTMEAFGLFHEFTKEALDFDSDDGLKDHLARILLNGATKTYELTLQRDLLLNAGVTIYAGAAQTMSDVTGEATVGPPAVPASIVTYKNLIRLDQALTDNHCPKHTKVFTGSLFTDTKTLPACRVAYVGSELVPLLQDMKDNLDRPAFIAVQHYAAGVTPLNGEIGSIGPFRFIQVPDMLHWAGKGATATANNPGYRTTNIGGTEKYNVYPILVVGTDSFSTIGFQTDGKSAKFQVMTRMPGKESMSHDNPYGTTGLSSIQWYYGILIRRDERIAKILTVAPE